MEDVGAVRGELEKLAESWIKPHLSRLEGHAVTPRPKIINDSLWGSLRLYSWEVALLDTYLMQRLRFLRQLGVVHWVFPGTGHSRLEHSLGVLHQMSELLDGLERTSGKAGIQVVDDTTRKLLRIAALLHDTGHSVMSHVSEAVMASLPGVPQLIQALSAEYETTKKISVSEAVSAVFIRSPAFNEFLASPAVGADFIADVDQATDQIARFVLGIPVKGKETLCLLMSGAFDADKLDYMPRDSMMAGIPCAVDVARVIEKVHAFDVPAESIPPLFRAVAVPDMDGKVKIVALSRAGERALSEIAIARTLLFDKVYYHHKVRALEVTVRRLLTRLRDSGQVKGVTAWLNLTDEHVLQFDDPDARRLRERNLLKRAFVIVPPDDAPGDKPETPGQQELTFVVKGKDRDWRRLRLSFTKALESEVLAEAQKIAAILDLPSASEPITVALDEPEITKVGLDQPAFVGDGPEDFRTAEAATTGERAEVAKRLARARAYLFTDERHVLPVFLAARSVLLKKYRQEYDQSCYASTKLDLETILTSDDELARKGYYSDGARPSTLRPARLRAHSDIALEAFLKSAWPRIERLGTNFGRYQSQGSDPVDAIAVADYLRQFKAEQLARTCLRILERIDFKDRKFFAEALERLIRAAVAKGPVLSLCPMGATGDSSALFTYLMNDIPEDLRLPVEPLELALERTTSGSLLVCDDFCGNGAHAITVLGQWLGTSSTELLEEHLVDPLNAERAESLKKRQVCFGFALARDAGFQRVKEFVSKAGIKAELLEPVSRITSEDVTFGPTGILKDDTNAGELKKFFEGKARELHEPKKRRSSRPWTEQKVEERLLGYGNSSQRLVFYYNVPTVTLTPLWLEGTHWKPLFKRREKPPMQPHGSASQTTK